MLGLDFIGGLISTPPGVPKAPHVNLDEQQTKAIAANQSSLGDISALASGVNSFNQEQLQKMLESAIPGYNNIVSGASSKIQDMLSGVVPKDVQDAIQTSAAGRSLAGGYGGTGMAHDLNARDLGLTSLDLINKGINSAQSWLGTMKAVGTSPQFDVTSMFITPTQRAANQWQNQTMKFQRNWLNSQIDASYSWNNQLGASLGAADQQISGIVGSAAGAAAGSGGGGSM